MFKIIMDFKKMINLKPVKKKTIISLYLTPIFFKTF